MKYKAVIFDLFGTLVDNFTNTEYQQVLTDMSFVLRVPPDKFSKLWRDSFYLRTNGTHRTHEESIRYICRELDVPVTDEQVERAAAMRLDYTVKTMVPRPEAITVINTLKSSGYKVGLISDCSAETPAVWAYTPFVDIFDATVFSCVVCLKKPDPRIYQLACERLGVKPEDCLYIGDGSSYELTGALKVGMRPILIRDPGETVDTHFVDREEDWQGTLITSLKEVLNLVSS
jgi:putative hydrolase of the HAD superfamily